jgi:hypothetical protein
MYNIALTRFNETTWNDYYNWCIHNKLFIYNTPVKIKNIIKEKSILFVIEMNNDLNKIMGISLIYNKLFNKRYKIYKSGNYNRYSYKSIYRIHKNQFNRNEIDFIVDLEIQIFKGKKHSKRGQGITILPNWILKDWTLENNKHNFIKNMFINRDFNF